MHVPQPFPRDNLDMLSTVHSAWDAHLPEDDVEDMMLLKSVIELENAKLEGDLSAEHARLRRPDSDLREDLRVMRKGLCYHIAREAR